MDDDLLLLGQVSAQPSHTNSDRTSTNDPVTDLVYPVLSPVHSVRSWVLPGEITSKCKADMDIDVNQSQFSLMMAFLKKSQAENQRLSREQEARMSMKLQQSHDRVVQVLGDELARTSEQLSRDLSSQVSTLRQDHSAQFQSVHEDIVGIKSVQAGIISEQEDLRVELSDKVDRMESRIATNVVDPLRLEFSAALLAKDQEIAALRSEGTSTARTDTESSSNVQLVAQLAEQATMIKKSNDQYFSLKSRLDFYEKRQAGVEHHASVIAPQAFQPVSFAQAVSRSTQALAQPQQKANSMLAPPQPMTKSTTVRGPAQGVYYGNVANEALPPVHEVRVSHVPQVPQVPQGQSLPTLPPYPDEPFSLFSIECAQCAVVLGPFESADLDYLGQELGDMSLAYIQAIQSFLAKKMLMPQDVINKAGIMETCVSNDKKLCVKFASREGAMALNAYKKNLQPGLICEDFIPPSLWEQENVLIQMGTRFELIVPRARQPLRLGECGRIV